MPNEIVKAFHSHREHADTGRDTLSKGFREKLLRAMAQGLATATAGMLSVIWGCNNEQPLENNTMIAAADILVWKPRDMDAIRE